MEHDRINYGRLEQEYDQAGESPEEFHLRIRLQPTPRDNTLAVQKILLTAASGILLVSLIHFSSLLPGSMQSIIYALCLMVPFGLMALLVFDFSVKQTALFSLVPPTAWLVAVVVRWMNGVPQSLYLVYVAGLLLALAVAGGVAEHYRCWLAPRLAPPTRFDKGFFSQWRSRLVTFMSRLRHSQKAMLAVAIFAVPLIVSHAVAHYTGRSLLAATTIGTICTLLLLAVALVAGLIRRTIDRTYLASPIDALLNYLSYAQVIPESVQHAPGVFRSPAGTTRQRVLMLGVAFYAIYVAVLPLTNYLPVYAPFISGDVWKTALDNAVERRLVPSGTPGRIQISFSSRGRDMTFDGPLYTPPKKPEPPDENELQKLDSTTAQKFREKRAAAIAAYPAIEQEARQAWQQKSDDWEQQQPARFLNVVPLGWAYLSFNAFGAAPKHFIVLYTMSIVFCLAYPAFILYVFMLGATRDALASISDDERAVSEGAPDDERWTAYTTTLANSSHSLERHALWVGTHSFLEHPVLLDRRILAEHGYIVGDSGSGKTALAVTSLVTQLIERSAGDVERAAERELESLAADIPRDCDEQQREDHLGEFREQATAVASSTIGNPVVIIDLKGDPALFQRTKKAAEDAGVTFKHFTNEVGKTSYAFNPLEELNTDNVSANQVAETILEALNLSHGEGYGRSYFSRVARYWLSNALKKATDDKPIEHFDQLYEFMQNDSDMDAKQLDDAFELVAVLESLGSIEHLNVGPITSELDKQVYDNAIHMKEVIAENQVVYFWLPALVETTTVREIAKLAVYALVQAARQQGQNPKQIYLFIDEFQRIASTGFKIILEQARSMGVGLILANQSVADLQTPDADLRPTVHNNTRCKVVFSAQDLEQQDHMMKASGESWSMRTLSLKYEISGDRAKPTGHSEGYDMHARLLRNDIIETSDDPKRCIVQVARGLGLSQYSGYSIPVDTLYTCSRTHYEDINNTPWPAHTQDTVFIKSRKQPPPEDITHKGNVVDADDMLEPEEVPRLTKRIELIQALDEDPKVKTFRDRLRRLKAAMHAASKHVH